MTVLAILGISLLLFVLGGAFYGRHIGRVFGEDPNRATPAVALEDGLDYVPTKTPVVFAHHFASIAGAGPIVGPIIGIVFGWLPAVIWIVGGAIFAGAVHDYAAMFVSVREKGKSIAMIARQTLGKTTFLLFVFLLIVLMVLVTAMFLILSAKALTSTVPAAALELSADQNLIHVDAAGDAHIGGIATMSVIIITAFAPLMGWLYLKRKTPVWTCSLLALGLCAASITIGVFMPVRVPSVAWIEALGFGNSSEVLWMLFLSGYCLLAAGLPVWIFLQSRDFVNVHILYIGIALLLVALVSAGLQGAPADFPMYQGLTVEIPSGGGMATMFIWPYLFITIACGACSGFHSLCASGTTAKQVVSERSIRRVGFYGMLLEGFLAVCVVCACLVGLSHGSYADLMLNPEIKANPVLTFAIAVGHTVNQGLGIPVAAGAVFGMLLLEGFLVTTLDTAIRLSRYLLQEAWSTIFASYDVFAEKELAEEQRIAGGACCGLEIPDLSEGHTGPHDPELQPAGAAGLETMVTLPHSAQREGIVATTGVQRIALKVLEHYWFNTALIVVLMLWMATTGHVLALWALFGSGNQLLAGLSLTMASCWLLSKGRSVAYTLVPAILMLATTLTMLVQLLLGYLTRLDGGATMIDGMSMADGLLATIVLAFAGGLLLVFGPRRGYVSVSACMILAGAVTVFLRFGAGVAESVRGEGAAIAPLLVFDLVILALTAGILVQAFRRLLGALWRPAPVEVIASGA